MSAAIAGFGAGFGLAALIAVLVLYRYQGMVLTAFREAEADYRTVVLRLTDKLAVRTAAPGPEQAAQVRLAAGTRHAGPSRELSDDEYRAAHRGVQPMGL